MGDLIVSPSFLCLSQEIRVLPSGNTEDPSMLLNSLTQPVDAAA
jgi:hypothetical protein